MNRTSEMKVFGVSIVAVLSLLAFNAAFAHATWLESGAAITGLKNFVAEIDLLGVLEVPTLNVELDCLTFSVKKGEILGSAHTEPNLAHLEVLLEKCDAYGTNPTLALDNGGACELYPTAADRTARTNEGNLILKALLKVIQHNNEHYLLMEDVLKTIFSRECIGVPNGTQITGSLVLELHEGALTNRVKQLVRPNEVLFPADDLKFGANLAKFGGSISIKLANGNPWGIC